MRNLTSKGQLYGYRIQHLDSAGNILVDEPTFSTNGPQAHRLLRQRIWRDDVLTGDQLVLLSRDGDSANWSQVELLVVEIGNDEEFFADLEPEDFVRHDLCATV
jgi:hypothetical protein